MSTCYYLGTRRRDALRLPVVNGTELAKATSHRSTSAAARGPYTLEAVECESSAKSRHEINLVPAVPAVPAKTYHEEDGKSHYSCGSYKSSMAVAMVSQADSENVYTSTMHIPYSQGSRSKGFNERRHGDRGSALLPPPALEAFGTPGYGQVRFRRPLTTPARGTNVARAVSSVHT